MKIEAAIAPHDHMVQLYEADDRLVRAVHRFIAPGLATGDAAIVVATTDHLRSLDAALSEAAFDVSLLRTQGRYVTHDAGETMAGFMVDGSPDPMRFTETVGELVANAASRGNRVRIFGEMVALLWAEGNVKAAIELEGLWNDLASIHPFTLLCAYPADLFEDPQMKGAFVEMCATHSHVMRAEDYA